MPARPGGDSAAGRGGPQPAGTAAGASGHGRNRLASRSAPAGASPPASLSNTKPPPPNDTDTRPDQGPASPAQIILALTASQPHLVGPVLPPHAQPRSERTDLHVMPMSALSIVFVQL